MSDFCSFSSRPLNTQLDCRPFVIIFHTLFFTIVWNLHIFHSWLKLKARRVGTINVSWTSWSCKKNVVFDHKKHLHSDKGPRSWMRKMNSQKLAYWMHQKKSSTAAHAPSSNLQFFHIRHRRRFQTICVHFVYGTQPPTRDAAVLQGLKSEKLVCKKIIGWNMNVCRQRILNERESSQHQPATYDDDDDVALYDSLRHQLHTSTATFESH